MALDMKKLSFWLYCVTSRRNVSKQELQTVNIDDFEDFIKHDMAVEVGVSLKDRMDWFSQSGEFGKTFTISGYFLSHEQMKQLLHAAFDQGLWEGRSGKRD